MCPSQARDRWLSRALGTTAALAAGIVVLIVLFLAFESLPALLSVAPGRWLSDAGWFPSAGLSGEFNVVPMLWGSLLLAAGSLCLAAPLGVVSSIFALFFAPRFLARPYRHLVQLLAGVPSVVYGFWGLVVLAPWVRRLHPPGPSLLTGILVLALMVLPTVALLAETALAAVPEEQLRAASALGLGRWATLRIVCLPQALPGIVSGVLLAAARAIGETMAVLMVSGNVIQIPGSLFDPVRALTANIALEMGYATAHHRSALFLCGLVLMMAVASSLLAAARFGRNVVHV